MMTVKFYIKVSIVRNVNERNEWLEALNSAVEEQRSRKASFNKPNDSVDMSLEEGEASEDTLGDTCPVWIPDSKKILQ